MLSKNLPTILKHRLYDIVHIIRKYNQGPIGEVINIKSNITVIFFDRFNFMLLCQINEQWFLQIGEEGIFPTSFNGYPIDLYYNDDLVLNRGKVFNEVYNTFKELYNLPEQ